jgi:hypothetical protein
MNLSAIITLRSSRLCEGIVTLESSKMLHFWSNWIDSQNDVAANERFCSTLGNASLFRISQCPTW